MDPQSDGAIERSGDPSENSLGTGYLGPKLALSITNDQKTVEASIKPIFGEIGDRMDPQSDVSQKEKLKTKKKPLDGDLNVAGEKSGDPSENSLFDPLGTGYLGPKLVLSEEA